VSGRDGIGRSVPGESPAGVESGLLCHIVVRGGR
jgi:hypothetical protein